MKSFNNKLILLLFIAGIFISCHKKEVINIPASAMKRFFIDNMVPTQFYSIDASKNDLISGINGTRIYFKAGSLKTSFGTIVTGKVEVELKEIYTKGDMILSGVFPIAVNQLLMSGGELFLRAKQNGNELLPVDPNSITIVMPVIPSLIKDTTNKMFAFYSDSSYLYNIENTDKWGTPRNPISRQDTMGTNTYYFSIERMNWINCDYFYNDPGPKTTISAKLTDAGFTSDNTMIFLSLKGLNVAARLIEKTSNNFSFSNQIPINLDVTFVAISEKNGQYYSSFTDTKIVNNHVQNLTLNPTTLKDIKTQLAALQ